MSYSFFYINFYIFYINISQYLHIQFTLLLIFLTHYYKFSPSNLEAKKQKRNAKVMKLTDFYVCSYFYLKPIIFYILHRVFIYRKKFNILHLFYQNFIGK